MMNNFLVVVPLNVKKLEMGLPTLKKTTAVVCAADTLIEVYMKYPHALIIKQLE